MRTWSVFLLLLATSAAGCLDSLPEAPETEETETTVVQTGLGPGNGTLYLHAAGGDLWMDTEDDGGETLSGTHTAATPAPTHRFKLRPSPERDVLVETLEVHLDTTASNIVGESPVHVVSLFVDGKEVDRESEGSPDLRLEGGGLWPAGADVELRVCVCPREASVTYGYALATDGDSLVTLGFAAGTSDADSGTGGNGGTGGSGSSGVTVSRQGDHWVAQRTETFRESTSAANADVSLATVVGGVTVRHGQGSHLTIDLSARGETEQEARDRLAAMVVDYSANNGATFVLDAGVRAPDGNWTGRSAVIDLALGPRNLVALDVDTTTADVEVGAFTGDAWDLSTTTGEVTARDIEVDRVRVQTTTGRITLDGTLGALEMDATTGDLALTGTVNDLTVDSTTGTVDADIRATASGTWSVDTTTGRVTLKAPEDASRGYDAEADTSTGDIEFTFRDAAPVGEQDDDHQQVRTNGYGTRSIQTRIMVDTSTGDVRAGP